MASARIKSFFYRLRTVADRSRRYSERNFKIIGAVAVLTLPLSTYIEAIVGDPAFNTVYIRSLAGLAGLPLLLHDKLPPLLQRNLEWVWIGSVTFALPLCFGIILTFDAAFTPHGEIPSSIMIYQYLAALFIFIQLINHGPLSAFLWLIATCSVLLVLLFIDAPNLSALQEVWLFPAPIYLTVLIIGSIMNRNVEIVQSEQLRAAAAIGTNIAHELRTPLASIRILAHGTAHFLPTLVAGYETAKSSQLRVEPIAPAKLRQLESTLETIQSEVTYANTIIDMLLANTREGPATPDRYEAFRISAAIGEAIHRFPFNNSKERVLVQSNVGADFIIFAPKPFIIHVLFNLIKNGLYYVQKSRHGTVVLSSQLSKNVGIVEVTDTGVGIPASLQPRIFDRFFSSDTRSQGAGIGLSFCKMVMESIGGEITCESVEGEYTTFRLIFPYAKPVTEEPAALEGGDYMQS